MHAAQLALRDPHCAVPFVAIDNRVHVTDGVVLPHRIATFAVEDAPTRSILDLPQSPPMPLSTVQTHRSAYPSTRLSPAVSWFCFRATSERFAYGLSLHQVAD